MSGIEKNPKSRRFLWGAATSSYQVEGGITNNDWDFFTRTGSIKKRIASLTKPSLLYKDSTQVHLQPAGNAANVWDPQYYQNDFELAKKMGMNAFRMGHVSNQRKINGIMKLLIITNKC